MRDFLREHSWPVAISVLLHGLLVVGFLLVTYLSNHQRMPSIQPLPIDAVVIDSRSLQAAQKVLTDRAEEEVARARDAAAAKAAAEAQAREADEANAANQAKEAAAAQETAQTKAAADAKAAAADAKAAQDAAAAKSAATTAAAAAAAVAVEQQHKAQAQAQQRATADKAAETERILEEARRAADARKALEAKQAEEEAKQAAAAKAAADAKLTQDKQAADAKRAADAKAKADREAELRRQLADEEHVSAVESGPLRDKYIAMLRNKIQNAWIKPPSATAGLSCMVEVTQVPGGEVTGARVTECNGDAGVRQSIENAVYRASPLPDPPDPALFERKITLRFVPNE
jgi:colicin import membrane protein